MREINWTNYMSLVALAVGILVGQGIVRAVVGLVGRNPRRYRITVDEKESENDARWN